MKKTNIVDNDSINPKKPLQKYSTIIDILTKIIISITAMVATYYAYKAFVISNETYNEQIQSRQPYVYQIKASVENSTNNSVSINTMLKNYGFRMAFDFAAIGYIADSSFINLSTRKSILPNTIDIPPNSEQEIKFSYDDYNIIRENHYFLLFIKYKDPYGHNEKNSSFFFEYVPNPETPFHDYIYMTNSSHKNKYKRLKELLAKYQAPNFD